MPKMEPSLFSAQSSRKKTIPVKGSSLSWRTVKSVKSPRNGISLTASVDIQSGTAIYVRQGGTGALETNHVIHVDYSGFIGYQSIHI